MTVIAWPDASILHTIPYHVLNHPAQMMKSPNSGAYLFIAKYLAIGGASTLPFAFFGAGELGGAIAQYLFSVVDRQATFALNSLCVNGS